MRKIFIVLGAMLVLGLALSACTTATPAATVMPAATAVPATVAPTVQAGPVQIRWFIGLGTGTDPAQLAPQAQAVEDFNKSQSQIQLQMEILPYAAAKDTLSTEIASGSAPDIIGPVGWAGSNAFYGQYLDIAP